MGDLGSFGTPKPPVDVDLIDSFDYFGERVRVNPVFGELDLVDFFDTASRIDDADTAQAMAALKGVFRDCILPDDFDTFWSTAKRERQGVEDLMQVVMAVVEAVADRPTVRPSDSSDGPSDTSGTSVADSSSRVVRRLEQDGRPSIALMVQQAQDVGSRASA